MRAMILAAGLGTRLKPFTDHHPKALALVNGKSLLQRNIEYLQQYGIKEVIVNVHHFADQIIDAVKKNNGWGSEVFISDETDEVLETGGGLLRAQDYFKEEESWVLMNADILTDLPLNKMIAAEHDKIGQLKAEWQGLNRPDRLQKLVDANLDLVPLSTQQIVRWQDVPDRPAEADMIGDKLSTLGLSDTATKSAKSTDARSSTVQKQ